MIKWTHLRHLRNLIQCPPNKDEYNLRIQHILINIWHLNHFSFRLPENIMDIILSTPLKFTSPLKDSYSWKCDSSGRFSTKSAYNLTSSLEPPNSESKNFPNLSWIWKIPTLPKIKHFLWISFYDILYHIKLC